MVHFFELSIQSSETKNVSSKLRILMIKKIRTPGIQNAVLGR
jgi:hypothetical protein